MKVEVERNWIYRVLCYNIMNRLEIIKRIDDENVKSVATVLMWIKTMRNNINDPSRYKKGDVFVYNDNHKSRPYVIIKQIKETVIAIPLTTTEDELSISSYDSRFFGKGYFSMSLLTLKTEHIKDKLVGVLDDNKSINEAFTLIKNYYNNG